MKQILKYIFTLCLLFVGVGSVMAEDDVIILKPTDDIQLRNDGRAAQSATGASYEFGSNNDAADNFFDFCALQKFDLTAVKERVDAGSKITKVTLTLTNSSNTNMILHLYKCDYDWSEANAPKWTDVNIESYVVEEGEVGSGKTVNGGAKPFELKNKEAVCPYDITKFQNVITDDKLMAYVNGAKGNSLGILIALGEWRKNSRPSVFSKDATAAGYGTSTTDEYQWNGSAWAQVTGSTVNRYAQMLTYFGMTEAEFQEAVAPKLTVYFSAPKPDPVVNINSKKGFTSLADAADAATAGDTLEINEDLTISSRVTIQKQLVIQAGKGKNVSIKRDGGYKAIVFLANKGDNQGDVTFRGGEGTLTFDGANVASTSDFFEANNGKVTLDGVAIKDCASTNKQGTICCNKGGGFISVNNVTIDNCSNTTSEGYPVLFYVGTNMKVGKVTVTNTNVACIYLENKNRSLEVIGEMDNNPLKLFVGSTFVVGDIIVKNCSDASKFVLANAGYKLEANGTNLVIAENPFNLNVTDLGWASMYLDFAATVPTGATAYYASSATASSIALTAIEAGSVIPANTGVIVKAAEGVHTFRISAETPVEVTDNLFEGVTVDTSCEVNSVYVLSGESTQAKPIFGLYTGTTLGAYKAYLPLDKVPASAKGTVEFTFEGTPTGIMNLTPALNQGEVVNLQGIKVNKNYKGVVIKNGKKYLNK